MLHTPRGLSLGVTDSEMAHQMFGFQHFWNLQIFHISGGMDIPEFLEVQKSGNSDTEMMYVCSQTCMYI